MGASRRLRGPSQPRFQPTSGDERTLQGVAEHCELAIERERDEALVRGKVTDERVEVGPEHFREAQEDERQVLLVGCVVRATLRQLGRPVHSPPSYATDATDTHLAAPRLRTCSR